ncbi:MAG: MalY/PatB family protein [Bacillota bacterium]
MYNFDQKIDRRGTNSMKWDSFANSNLLPMWVADMDFQSPPAVIDALKERAEHGVFGYPAELDSYHQAIVDWMAKRHNWQIEQEWISTTPGVIVAINHAIQALTNPGDKVVLQSPVYYPFFKSIQNNGCQLVDNPLQYNGSHYEIDFRDLERKLDSRVQLMILCSPHNPVGRVWTKEELKRLGELCLSYDVTVIADEIHSDLILNDNQHHVFATLNQEFAQNCIVCNSPSKTFNLAGVQTSNIIIPNQQIRSDFQHGLASSGLGEPNVFAIAALQAAYNQGAEWLDELLHYLEENLNYLLNYIEDNLPQVEVIKPEGTYLVWLDFRKLDLSTHQLDNLIRNKAELVLNPGHIFGETGAGFQRMNIACPRATLKEGLQRLKTALVD